MKEQIITLFDKTGKDKIPFTPEIKVRRKNDILYIIDLTKLNGVYRATVEVGTSNDKASMPLGLLDELSLKAILIRLQGMGKPLLASYDKKNKVTVIQ